MKPGVCTSSTRPASPYDGQVIYETDTDSILAYNGSAWIYQSPSRFSTEAERNTLITSPVEGMVAYITSPTVPAATGGTTFIPTGITTVYNGTSWVCTTPVSSFTSTPGTLTSTSFTPTLSGGGVNPSVTTTTGNTALVTIRSYLDSNGVGNSAIVGVAVSGATTLAPSGDYSLMFFKASNSGFAASTTLVIGGLTAGTNTFTLNYIVNGATGTFERRGITVQGIA
jgi:hypothetical protein